jgi:predicted PhzF superfamily epimerase YddE/YHI9
VIVTSLAPTAEYDFVSRYFAPRVGVDEDPVTGSNHCCLGPFWGARLGLSALRGFQASPRGGIVGMQLAGPYVYLSGRTVTIFHGQLLV